MAALGVPLLASSAKADGVALATGDVLAGSGNGTIEHLSSSGTLIDTLNTTSGSTEDTGMCFDGSGNLYATNFEANTMSKFDGHANLLQGSFGSGFNAHPESCSFSAAGDMYVGQADGSGQVLEFDASGNLLNTFSPAREDRGTDWVDLAKDQCTLQYTSEGSIVHQFNVCTNTQLPDFATGLPGPCYAHRLLADGSVLVACTSEVAHLSPSGAVIQTYTPGGSTLFALNLDPDGTSFWTADLPSGQIWRIDIATGAVITTFNAHAPVDVAGLAIVGEITASQPEPTTVTTSLAGGGSSGSAISVAPNTAVTDSATLAGAKVASAGGTLTYSVFSDAACTVPVTGSSTTVNVTGGVVPASNPVTLPQPGTYYWTASYSGDPNNAASSSGCGSETETVTASNHVAPTVDDSCTIFGTTPVTTTPGLDTTAPGDLLVAYATADGPKSGGQTLTISGLGLTWTRVAQETAQPGDAEVWTATEPSVITNGKVTVSAAIGGYHVYLTVVAYKNATGIGSVGKFAAASGAPTGSVTTTQDHSWVWAVGFDWTAPTKHIAGTGQTIFQQLRDTGSRNDDWVQSTTAATPAAGTPVTINDTAPTTDNYDMVLVEIL